MLTFLKEAALLDDATPIDRIVVTVPASFQAAQRQDTVTAAALAHIDLEGGDLLDEPIAAFLDYLIARAGELIPQLRAPKRLLVLDFGGGTCDVAIFQLNSPARSSRLRVAPLSVSRYHRLGGGDIDAAILYEALLPQLLEQNGLDRFDLSYEEKKKYVEPALLSVAEMLKIGLCTEIARLLRFDRYEDAAKDEIVKKLPGVHPCALKDRTLTLQSPQLTAEQFEEILEPFLDTDLLYARETEYRMMNSIFAPIEDALDRGGLLADDIDLCLLVGGSSLIPQVIAAMQDYFSQAQVLTYADRDDTQTAIAKGAAFHALALALFGQGLVQTVCHDRIAIRTAGGDVELIPQGATLPYPSDDGFARNQTLAVPASVLVGDVDLRVELIAGESDDGRVLFSGLWQIPGPVNAGEPLLLEYRYDENQVLQLKLSLLERKSARAYEPIIENPLTNVVNPQNTRLRIDEMEEALRTNPPRPAQISYRLEEIAQLYAELRQYEKAIDYLKRALKGKGGADADIVNLMANYYSDMGDTDRALRLYHEATELVPNEPVYWFNIALMYREQGRYQEGFAAVEKALALRKDGPSFTLRAQFAEKLGNNVDRDHYLQEAFRVFGPLPTLRKWEFAWYQAGARMSGDQALIDAGLQEQRRRSGSHDATVSDGLLPEILPAIVKAES